MCKYPHPDLLDGRLLKYFERTFFLHGHFIITADNCDSVGVRKFLTLTFDKPLSYKFRQFFTTELHPEYSWLYSRRFF